MKTIDYNTEKEIFKRVYFFAQHLSEDKFVDMMLTDGELLRNAILYSNTFVSIKEKLETFLGEYWKMAVEEMNSSGNYSWSTTCLIAMEYFEKSLTKNE